MTERKCSVIYKSGKVCHRPAVAGSSWCAKHKPFMEAVQRQHVAMLRKEAQR